MRLEASVSSVRRREPRLLGDNADLLPTLPSAAFQLIYVDPPFNTGRGRVAERSRPCGTRPAIAPASRAAGIARSRSESRRTSTRSTTTSPSSSRGFARPTGCSTPTGTFYFHIDYREAHYCKVLLDEIFGRESFLNEIIWAYDYGARTKRKWPAKHDTILVYVKDPDEYFFDAEAVDREPYMAPGLVTAEKAARGKLPTDVWWHTIVSPTGKEKTGYPTQKPEGILRRIVQASSRPGDWCLDFFAGSGTLGAVAAKLGRRYVLIDSSPEAVRIIRQRLGPLGTEKEGFEPSKEVITPLTP